MKPIALATLALLASSFSLSAGPLSPTGEANTYIGVILGSQHFGTDSLNNNTPGLTIGRRYQLEADRLEGFIEGGVFYNSYEEVAPLAFAGYTARIANLTAGELRLGGFLGIGYYEELGEALNEQYGLPYVEGFIPMVGATASYRLGRHELRLTTVPSAGDVDAIANLSYAFSF